MCSTLRKIFKKGNGAVNRERYEKETILTLIGREQVHYFEMIGHIWNQFKPCELNIGGVVTLTLKFLEDRSERMFRVDMRSTTTDVLFQAIKEYAKEFGRKASTLDPSDFEFYLSPVSAVAARDGMPPATATSTGATGAAGSGAVGGALIPILPAAPLWLYSLRKEDILILVRRDSGNSAAAAGLVNGCEGNVTVKVVLAESNAGTTFMFPQSMTVRDATEFVNNYRWNSLGISYRKLDPENTKYYGLYYLSSSQGWILLDEDSQKTFADYTNLSLFITTYRRKRICELELQCVAGSDVPNDLIRKVNNAANAKLLLSLDYTVPEAEAYVLDWFNKM